MGLTLVKASDAIAANAVGAEIVHQGITPVSPLIGLAVGVGAGALAAYLVYRALPEQGKKTDGGESYNRPLTTAVVGLVVGSIAGIGTHQLVWTLKNPQAAAELAVFDALRPRL